MLKMYGFSIGLVFSTCAVNYGITRRKGMRIKTILRETVITTIPDHYSGCTDAIRETVRPRDSAISDDRQRLSPFKWVFECVRATPVNVTWLRRFFTSVHGEFLKKYSKVQKKKIHKTILFGVVYTSRALDSSLKRMLPEPADRTPLDRQHRPTGEKNRFYLIHRFCVVPPGTWQLLDTCAGENI